ncbi:MAG: biotin carboxyl carrier domain-containing protein [Rhodobacteraceae bacterium]|nr:biotin carboxyl carrier domain-containing protein [Paracoccaceae bacterium]
MPNIQSPLPGTFYQKPSPDDAAFKVPGNSVAEGDTIGLVEVMKTFIEVKAETAGTFGKYLIDDATPIQAGDAIAEFEG